MKKSETFKIKKGESTTEVFLRLIRHLESELPLFTEGSGGRQRSRLTRDVDIRVSLK